MPSCTLSGDVTTGTVPLFVTFTGTYSDFASFDYINYNDGSTGTDFEHTYTEPGDTYSPRMYVYNTSYPSQGGLCQFNSIYVGATYCGDGDVQTPNSDNEIEECDNGGLLPQFPQPIYGVSGSITYCTDSCTNAIYSYN